MCPSTCPSSALFCPVISLIMSQASPYYFPPCAACSLPTLSISSSPLMLCLHSVPYVSHQLVHTLSRGMLPPFHPTPCCYNLRMSRSQRGLHSLQFRHTQPGRLLDCSNESSVFTVGLCILINLLKASPYLLCILDLETRIGCQCLPVVPDFVAWLGDPDPT